jgi:hypothetical protein
MDRVVMLLHAALIALTVQSVAPGKTGSPTPDVAKMVRTARRAVERDSVAAVSAQFRALLRGYPRDRAAALGLATIAAYTYHYTASDRAYRALLPKPGERLDPAAVWARLLLAISLRLRGQFRTAEPIAAQAVTEAFAIADTAAEVEALLNLATIRGRTRGREARDSALAAAAPLIRAVPALEPAYRCAHAASSVAAPNSNAEQELREAAEQAQRIGDRRTHGGCLFVLAQLLMARARAGPPFQLLDQAIIDFTAIHDRAAAGNAYQWAGSTSWRRAATASRGRISARPAEVSSRW